MPERRHWGKGLALRKGEYKTWEKETTAINGVLTQRNLKGTQVYSAGQIVEER